METKKPSEIERQKAFDKITKAKVQLQQKQPFFAHLVLYLNCEEFPENFPTPMRTCGVDVEGNMWYDVDFINSLSEENMEFVVTHETLHCLTQESLVLTDEGFKQIQDIKVGDKVYSHDGFFTKVLAKSKKWYEGDTYTYKPRFGVPVTFTNEHPIQAIKCNDFRVGWGFNKSMKHQNISPNQIRYYKAQELNKNDGLVFNIPSFTRKSRKKLFNTRNHYEVKKVFLDKDIAYFLGFFVGDGSLHSHKSSGEWFKKGEKFERIITLTLSEKDDSDRLMKIVKEKFYRSPSLLKVKGVKAKRITFSSKSLAKILRREFYLDKEKRIPKWLIYEDKEIVKSFIEGLQNADGTKTKDRCSITSVSKGVYSMLPLLLMKLKIIPSLNKQPKPKKPTHRQAYRVDYTLDRKKNTGMFLGNKFIMPLEKKTKGEYKGWVYNLETKAHTYCVPYFITHNCALLHLYRCKKRNPIIFNIASDLCVNNILIQNGFKPLKETLNPEQNHFTFRVNGKDYLIDDIHKKNAEIIYDELIKFMDSLPKQKIGMRGSGGKGNKSGNDVGDFGGFDEHYFAETDGNGSGDGKDKNKVGTGKGKGGKKLTSRDLDDLESKWKKISVTASEYSKNCGKTPLGMDRMIGDILNDKVNWKHLLYRYITNTIPIDFTYSRPSKKSIATGFYMPSVKREEIEITAVVDTSGSIGQEELKEFVGEIIGIAKSFNNIKMRLICCDYEVQADYEVANGNIEKIRNLNFKGGGGTNYNVALKYIDQKYPNTKLVVYLGDGYCDGKVKEKDYPFHLIWILSKGGSDENIKGSGQVIRIED